MGSSGSETSLGLAACDACEWCIRSWGPLHDVDWLCCLGSCALHDDRSGRRLDEPGSADELEADGLVEIEVRVIY